MSSFVCFSSCFRGRKPDADKAGDSSFNNPEKSVGYGSDGSDLLIDEGASFQQDLWQSVLHRELAHMRRFPVDAPVHTEHTPEIFLQALTAAYNKDGSVQHMPRIRSVFMAIEPFVTAINTMASSNMLAALVWGSMTVIFQCILRFAYLFDDTSRMFTELAKTLPRFHAYTEIFHTPQLHRALREVYEGFLDFCFKAIEVLGSNKCYTVMRATWASFAGDFERTRASIKAATSDFENEARLANVQEQYRRHHELLAKIGSISTVRSGSTITEDPITNVVLPRNERFTGRDDILTCLHSELAPSFHEEDPFLRSRCSCVINAIGGMGKTETALEYTYRYRHCYRHVFWLRSQSGTTVLESFLDVVAKLGLEEEGVDPEKRVQAGLHWFQTTINPWLLVFDNAETYATIRKFWPAGHRGAIIVTSQNPLLAHNTKSRIHLQPMPPEEGCALIQSYLRRGGSEQESAKLLSVSLGGLPLAIAHFAGYVARSQCPLDQICDSFKQRAKSSQVWRSRHALDSSPYDLTLNTVWELAFKRLSPDSRRLLEFIAFLDPDQVPIEMFVGPNSAVHATNWQYWDIDRFDAAIGILHERHLVERYNLPSGNYLRTHRALQRTVLQELDTNVSKRQEVFEEVVEIVRKAFPEANIITRGDTSQYTQSAKYLTQLVSIHTNFTQSEPPIEKMLAFAGLLSDAGYYGVNNAIQAEAFDLLETAESICTTLLVDDPVDVRPVLGNVLGPLLVMTQYLGADGRRKAVEMSRRNIAIREQQLAGVPREQWTLLDFVNVGRAYNDVGVSLSQLNKVEEASQWFDRALECYKSAGNEATLTSRFGHIYCFQLLPLAIRQDIPELRQLADRSLALITKSVGVYSPLFLQTKFYVAMTLFTVGCVDEALEAHKETFEKRLARQGASHHLTLGSQYNLAVCYQNRGDLETAEILLQGNLQDGCITNHWRREDVVRTKFRLSIVLHAQQRPGEAKAIREEIGEFLENIHVVAKKSTWTDEDDMELLDAGVLDSVVDNDVDALLSAIVRCDLDAQGNRITDLPWLVSIMDVYGSPVTGHSSRLPMSAELVSTNCPNYSSRHIHFEKDLRTHDFHPLATHFVELRTLSECVGTLCGS